MSGTWKQLVANGPLMIPPDDMLMVKNDG